MHPNVKRLLDREYDEQRSEAWLKMRGQMLTASDGAAAIGANKYQSPLDLILKKCGLGEPFVGNEATAHGTRLEPVAIEMFEEKYGEKVNELGLIPHEKYPWLGGSPDGLTDTNCLIEVKCPFRRQIERGVVPLCYEAQIQVCMEIMDVESCFLFSMHPMRSLFLNQKCLMSPSFPVIGGGLRNIYQLWTSYGRKFFTTENTWMRFQCQRRR